ncbi:hypothetical protein [Variovorax terrae]|uniref:Uncharacterized protein n=1 Tax=Variovorax terrae TaxID=2923278 RepID=A0A9X2ALV4_9BURK|nr:hypothetical protein [Variovorax terrae]MCJ0762694.1 hypothetical protein [Variovorax terrae]
MKYCRPLVFALWSLLLSMQALAQPLYYNIAHAINNSRYIGWAVAGGANGIEADLNFAQDGALTTFQHRTMCECQTIGIKPFDISIHLFKETGICKRMMHEDPEYKPDSSSSVTLRVTDAASACNVYENATSYLRNLAAHPSIALFIIDSKVARSFNKNDDVVRGAAGRNVVAAINQHLFGAGYRGKVVVGVADSKDHAYIRGAVEAAKSSPYRDRIYFSFDEDGGGWVFVAKEARSTIALINSIAGNKAVYGYGISANLERRVGAKMEVGVAAEKAGQVQGNYVWTIDAASSMDDYLKMGVRGIMTNWPSRLNERIAAYIRLRGGRLAEPGDPF